MKLVANISQEELNRIQNIVGEAFITNELFYEFGDYEARKNLVMNYMKIYVDYVYESKALYQSDDGCAFIGLEYSDKKNILPQLKMLIRLLFAIPFPILRRYLEHIKQIKDGNAEYASNPHLEVLMVCVQ